MNQTRKTPARSPVRKQINPVFVLMLLSVAVLIALIVFLAMLKKQQNSGPSGTESHNTAPSSATVPNTSQPTDPSPQSTPPVTTQPPTEPAPPTAQELISQFAAQHDLTLADYPEDLIALFERNPEAREFVLNYPLEYGKDHAIDISGHANDAGVPLFLQWDRQWGYKEYAGKVAGLSACGPTCMSMVAYHFARDAKYTPAYMMDFAMSNKKYAVNSSGTMWAFFQEGTKELGLSVRELTLEQSQTESHIANTVQNGEVIVMNVKPGVFTTVGHYLLIVGYEDGKFRVNDPNSRSNSEKLWAFSEFSDQVRIMWAISE